MMRKTIASRTLLAAGVASVALLGGACAADDGSVSPGQEAPADPMAPADGGATTGGSTTGGSTGIGTTTS